MHNRHASSAKKPEPSSGYRELHWKTNLEVQSMTTHTTTRTRTHARAHTHTPPHLTHTPPPMTAQFTQTLNTSEAKIVEYRRRSWLEVAVSPLIVHLIDCKRSWKLAAYHMSVGGYNDFPWVNIQSKLNSHGKIQSLLLWQVDPIHFSISGTPSEGRIVFISSGYLVLSI